MLQKKIYRKVSDENKNVMKVRCETTPSFSLSPSPKAWASHGSGTRSPTLSQQSNIGSTLWMEHQELCSQVTINHFPTENIPPANGKKLQIRFIDVTDSGDDE